MMVLLILLVFLIAFLINPAKLAKIDDRVLSINQSPPSVPTPFATTSKTPENISASAPPIKVYKEENIDRQPVPKPAEKKSPPAVEQMPKDNPGDVSLQVTDKADRMDDHAFGAATETIQNLPTSTSTQVLPPPPVYLPTMENTGKENALPEEASETIDTPSKPTQDEEPTIEEQDRLKEKKVPPSATVQQEEAIPAPLESANVQTSKEDPVANKMPGKQTTGKEEKPTAQKTMEEAPGDLPRDLSKPKEAAETEDLSPGIRENTDPGAVIDYILKKRPK